MWVYVGSNNGWLQDFAIACVVVAIATEIVGLVARKLSSRREANAINAAKFHEQLWQMAVHMAMA